MIIFLHSLKVLRWLETLFEECEKNGFEHYIVDYYCVLKGNEYQWYAEVTK